MAFSRVDGKFKLSKVKTVPEFVKTIDEIKKANSDMSCLPILIPNALKNEDLSSIKNAVRVSDILYNFTSVFKVAVEGFNWNLFIRKEFIQQLGGIKTLSGEFTCGDYFISVKEGKLVSQIEAKTVNKNLEIVGFTDNNQLLQISNSILERARKEIAPTIDKTIRALREGKDAVTDVALEAAENLGKQLTRQSQKTKQDVEEARARREERRFNNEAVRGGNKEWTPSRTAEEAEHFFATVTDPTLQGEKIKLASNDVEYLDPIQVPPNDKGQTSVPVFIDGMPSSKGPAKEFKLLDMTANTHYLSVDSEINNYNWPDIAKHYDWGISYDGNKAIGVVLVKFGKRHPEFYLKHLRAYRR